MRYLFAKCGYRRSDNEWFIPAEWAERWRRQMETPYANLPSGEQDSDRVEASRVLELLATERQSHAAQLAEKDAEIARMRVRLSRPRFVALEAALTDLTATRAEIAVKDEEIKMLTRMELRERLAATNARVENVRLTDERNHWITERDKEATDGQRARVGENNWMARAEAAEASLLALQQQMEAVLLRMNVSGTWGAVEKLIAEARAALASSLTGRSQ